MGGNGEPIGAKDGEGESQCLEPCSGWGTPPVSRMGRTPSAQSNAQELGDPTGTQDGVGGPQCDATELGETPPVLRTGGAPGPEQCWGWRNTTSAQNGVGRTLV